MSKGWNTVGSLLIAVAFFVCLMFSKLSLSLHGGQGGASYSGTVEGALITFAAVMIAWFGIRDGQRWAWWTLLVALLTIAIQRLAVDRTCTVQIFWKHGCHQFMLGLVIGAIGFILSRD
jgi:hypothetical protein